jgi:uncharacterized membrane protein
MTLKKFKIYRLILAIILGSLISFAIVINNYVLAIGAVIMAVIITIMLKKGVKEIMVDERDYELAGKAGRAAISIFSVFNLAVIFILLIFRWRNPSFEVIATILAYSVCLLMIIYSLIFKYYSSDKTILKNKTAWLIIFIVFSIIVVMFTARFFSGEDDWICLNGQWVEHGHPDFPKPDKSCQ